MLQHKYQVGRFDRKILILKKIVTINSFNGESDDWEGEVYKRPWAMDVSKTGYEGIEADKITSVRKTTLAIRYDSTITEEMRVVLYEQVYGIISVKQPQGIRKRFLELECEFLEGEFFVEGQGAFSSGFSSGFDIA